ncbi:MAG: hypothetical protein ACREQK_15170, partial [Candidatus Binatia bacterium]
SGQGIGLDAFEKLIEVRTLSHGFGQMIQMTSMIFGGVFDRFPRLKFIAREDLRAETKNKILKETPRRMYGVMN